MGIDSDGFQNSVAKVPHQNLRLSDGTNDSDYKEKVDIQCDEKGCYDYPLIVPLYTNYERMLDVLDQVIHKRNKKQLISYLQLIEPRLEEIIISARDGKRFVIYVGFYGIDTMLPLMELGHGFSRLLELYSSLLVTDVSLALIDEIENGIHYSALPTVFKGIREISESNGVQSIITTHSWECIRAAYETFKDKPEDFQLIRLERVEDNVRAVCINDENLKTIMAEGYEIR